MKYLLVLGLASLMLEGSCKKAALQSQAVIDEARIKTYLTTNKIQALRDSSGLYFEILSPGNGVNYPGASSMITINYMGTLLNGTIFSSTTNSNGTGTTPITLQLGTTVTGFQIGVEKISKGGSILLLIPSALGYGKVQQGQIPPNSVLIYQVELLQVY